MQQPWGYFARVAAICFALGAGMEAFMLRTGFYDKVTQLEAERLEESREDREAFLTQLRAELERQSAEKGVKLHLPPAPSRSSSGSGSGGGGSGGGGEQPRQ